MDNLTSCAFGSILDDMLATLPAEVRATAGATATATHESVTALAAGSPHALDAVAALRRLNESADALLRLAVTRARVEGRTWTQLGAALGSSRQAAFQRYGRTGSDLREADRTAAGQRAVAVLVALAAGDFEGVYGHFDGRMAASLDPGRLAGLWADVTGSVGQFDHVERPVTRRVGDHTVVDVPIAFEAGELTGRVALDDDGRVAGLFVLELGALR